MQAVFQNLASDAQDAEKERFVAICHASLLQLSLAQGAALPVKIETELALDPDFMNIFNHSAFSQLTSTESWGIDHKDTEKDSEDQTNLVVRLLQEMHHIAKNHYEYIGNLDLSKGPAAEANNLYAHCLQNLRERNLKPFKQPLIASPSFNRMQRTTSAKPTDSDPSLPSIINELKEKNAHSFDTLFSICNEETGADFKHTCGIPFTLLQSTAKLATEKDCAFFFRSINPIFPLLVEKEKKALMHGINKLDHPGSQTKTRLTAKSLSIHYKTQKGEHNLVAGYVVGECPPGSDLYKQIKFTLTRKQIDCFIQEGKISLPLYSKLAQGWILTSPQGDYVWLCPSNDATLVENESLSLYNIVSLDQSTVSGIDKPLSVLGKYNEDKSEVLFVTPDLDVCTVAYKKETEQTETYYKETDLVDLANFAPQSTPPQYVIKGKGTPAYFDLAHALLEKFSHHKPYSEIQMIHHGPEASNPTPDLGKLSPLKNIVAILPPHLATNPILCKTEEAFAKLVHALQDRAYIVEIHPYWNLSKISASQTSSHYTEQTHPFYTTIQSNGQTNQTQISSSPPHPQSLSQPTTP